MPRFQCKAASTYDDSFFSGSDAFGLPFSARNFFAGRAAPPAGAASPFRLVPGLCFAKVLPPLAGCAAFTGFAMLPECARDDVTSFARL